MSKKCDKLPQIRLEPKNNTALESLKRRMPFKLTKGALANTCIEKGVSVLESELKGAIEPK